MFYQQPPVGNPVRLVCEGQPGVELSTFFDPYQPVYYASGTAALAAAVSAAIKVKDVAQPEVIVPAYGCPDLISAAVYAGARPVLVDLEQGRPWLDLEHLLARVSSSTVAIVAVSMFGIPERIALLRPIAEQVGALIIEDSAQAFPGIRKDSFWRGDLVVLSFGRGKPINLMGGGAVLYKTAELAKSLPIREPGNLNVEHRFRFQLKARLFNRIIAPGVYWLPYRLPFLHLGETRYYPLSGIEAMDAVRLGLLPANIKAYQDNGGQVQNLLSQVLEGMDSESSGVVDLPRVCRINEECRLLRYPLLVERTMRERLFKQLWRLGSGPSLMYPAILPKLSGLEGLLEDQGAFPRGEAFAASILTLPTHGQIRKKDIENISRSLCSAQCG